MRHHPTLCPAPPPNQWQNPVDPILCHQTWTPEHPTWITMPPRNQPQHRLEERNISLEQTMGRDNKEMQKKEGDEEDQRSKEG